jgi:hypothetical protein
VPGTTEKGGQKNSPKHRSCANCHRDTGDGVLLCAEGDSRCGRCLCDGSASGIACGFPLGGCAELQQRWASSATWTRPTRLCVRVRFHTPTPLVACNNVPCFPGKVPAAAREAAVKAFLKPGKRGKPILRLHGSRGVAWYRRTWDSEHLADEKAAACQAQREQCAFQTHIYVASKIRSCVWMLVSSIAQL